MKDSASESVTLRSVPQSVPAARHQLVEWLSELAPQRVLWDAELAVSELATNAVRHGGDAFVLRLQVWPGGCRVEVEDNGQTSRTPPMPRQQALQELAEDGRGMAIVSTLGDMGHELTVAGTLAWVEIKWPTD